MARRCVQSCEVSESPRCREGRWKAPYGAYLLWGMPGFDYYNRCRTRTPGQPFVRIEKRTHGPLASSVTGGPQMQEAYLFCYDINTFAKK